MSFISLISSWLQPAAPVKSEIFVGIKNNQDDHETRISDIEASAGKIEVFNFPVSNALTAASLSFVSYYIAQSDFNLTEAKVVLFERGSATGTLELDVKINTTTGLNPANYSSVFSTNPSITLSGSVDYNESSNAVFSTTAVSQGDYLRLDFSSLGTAPVSFHVYIYGEVS